MPTVSPPVAAVPAVAVVSAPAVVRPCHQSHDGENFGLHNSTFGKRPRRRGHRIFQFHQRLGLRSRDYFVSTMKSVSSPASSIRALSETISAEPTPTNPPITFIAS